MLISLMLFFGLQTAQAESIPWFNQRAAEQLVDQHESDWLAHLKNRYQDDPGRYANRLHEAVAMVAQQDTNPALYQAWHRLCAAELAFREAAVAYHAAPEDTRSALQAMLIERATQWESARVAMYAAKIPQTEERLYQLEASLSDLQANFDSFVMDHVLNTTDP